MIEVLVWSYSDALYNVHTTCGMHTIELIDRI